MLDSLADLVQCSSCGPCDCESGKGKNNSVYSRWAGRRDPTIPGPIRQPGKKNGSDSDAGSKASSVPELSGGTTNQQQDSRTCSEDTDILTSLMAMVKAGTSGTQDARAPSPLTKRRGFVDVETFSRKQRSAGNDSPMRSRRIRTGELSQPPQADGAGEEGLVDALLESEDSSLNQRSSVQGADDSPQARMRKTRSLFGMLQGGSSREASSERGSASPMRALRKAGSVFMIGGRSSRGISPEPTPDSREPSPEPTRDSRGRSSPMRAVAALRRRGSLFAMTGTSSREPSPEPSQEGGAHPALKRHGSMLSRLMGTPPDQKSVATDQKSVVPYVGQRAKALFHYHPTHLQAVFPPDPRTELTLTPGMRLDLIEVHKDGWCVVRKRPHAKEYYVPGNYITADGSTPCFNR